MSDHAQKIEIVDKKAFTDATYPTNKSLRVVAKVDGVTHNFTLPLTMESDDAAVLSAVEKALLGQGSTPADGPSSSSS